MDTSCARDSRSPIKQLSATKKALLQKRLRGELKGLGKVQPIGRRSQPGPAPLSFTQQQLWFIDQLEPGVIAYNLPAALRLQGRLDRTALESALQDLMERHEILRTVFAAPEGSPVQVVEPPQEFALQVIEVQGFPASEQWVRAEQLMTEEARRPFDLTRGPLFRSVLLRLDEEEHVLVVVMHHIISDGWSMGVFFKELEQFYQARHVQTAGILPPLPIQYADYAAWQQQSAQEEAFQEEIKYWKNKLAGAPDSVGMPTDFTPPAQSHFRGSQLSIQLPAAARERLQDFAQEQQSTPFLTMLTALNIVLQRWTKQSDLVIGTVVAGRTRRETEKLIGCFMNFLPLRVKVEKTQTGLELLARVKSSFWKASAHQECPFEKIVEAINPARKLNQNPLYNVAFLMQNWPRGHWQQPGLQAVEVPIKTEAALLDLRWLAEEEDGGFLITCEYDLELFEPATVQLLLNSFRAVLERLIAAPQTTVEAYAIAAGLMQQAERARVQETPETLVIAASFTAEPLEEGLRYWAQELELPLRVEFAPYSQVFQQLLDPGSQFAANPQGLNVVLLRVEDWTRSSSSAEPAAPAGSSADLQRDASELVAALKGAAARTPTPFLVILCPGSEFGVAHLRQQREYRQIESSLARELGALSGVYAVTPEEIFTLYPVAHYSDEQADHLGHVPYTPQFFAGLATLILRKFHALKRPPRKVIALDCDQTLWTGVCGEDSPAALGLESHRVALQEFLRRQYEAGMLLCLCSKNNEEDVWAVFEQRPEMPLRREHLAASRINWQPKSENLRSLAAELRLGLDSFILLDDNPVECAEVDAACPEVLTLQLPESAHQLPGFLEHAWIFDHLKLTGEDRNRNLLYQQNRAREQLQAQSIRFSDFLAGLDLKIEIHPARPEHLSRVAQLTQRTNQFNCSSRRRTETELRPLCESKEMICLAVQVQDRFGDYGLVGVMICQTINAALEVDTFLLSCRALGKGVEHQMLAHLGQRAQGLGLSRVDVRFVPSAKNAPALRFLEKVGGAFRQTSHAGSVFRFPADYAAEVTFIPEENEWKAPVEAAPAPSTPAEGFVLPARFPRCRWIALHAQEPGEILKAIEARNLSALRSEREYLAPRTVTEQQLCRIWEALLRVPRLGVQDDFWQLGGTSLLAVRLFAQITKAFGKSLPLVTLFRSPTIEQLAALIDRKKTRLPNSPLVAIQPKGAKPPLVLVHGAGGGLLWGYANLAMKLGTDQPVYAIEPRRLSGTQAYMTVEELARRYVQELCDFQSQGPYYLGGYCFGGYIAFEMARQLSEQGKKVALLAIIDGAAPNGDYERIPWWRPGFYLDFIGNCYWWLANFRRYKPSEQSSFLRRKASVAVRKVLLRLGWKVDPNLLEVEDFIDTRQFPEDELQLWESHLRAGSDYVPGKYPGRVTLLRTHVQPILCSFAPHYGWGELAEAGVDIRLIPGSHENIFLEPDLHALAAELQSCLTQAEAQAGPDH